MGVHVLTTPRMRLPFSFVRAGQERFRTLTSAYYVCSLRISSFLAARVSLTFAS